MPTLTPLRQLDVVAEDCIGEVHGPNYSWEPELKGQLQLRDYQGEDLSKIVFLGEEDRQFTLGTRKAGQEEPLADHWDVVKPLQSLPNLLEPILLRYTRGGAKFFGLFATNYYVEDDFRLSEKETPSDVRFALGIWNDVAKRRLRMQVGFFRVVCLNGLFSQILGLSEASFTHQALGGTDLVKVYDDALTSPPAKFDYPAILPGRSLRRIAPLLTETEERGPIPDELRTLVSPIARCPNWFVENLQAQLLVAEPGVRYSSLQLVNLTTNAVAERIPDERPGWFFWRQDQIIQALWRLTMVANYFMN